jgi:GDP-mannose 6-dehydrogenase
MKVSVFGLGYVGAVSAACLAKEGHEVVGVDPNPTKVALTNGGRSPIIEKGVDGLISAAVAEGRLRSTASAAEGVADSDLSLICVGTPSQANGSLNLDYVRGACKEIGEALRDKESFHVVVMRSTVLPGTMKDLVIPALQDASGKQAGKDFGVCNNPEFLREGSAVYDFYNPPKTVVGETDAISGDRLLELYAGLDAPVIRTDVATAEMVKYVDNVWHALKVGFANEVGNLCKVLELDGHKVMDIFCQDTKLNLSRYYLKPGFSFGGSCLPKDVRALAYKAKSLDVSLPIVAAILPSNELQTQRGVDLVMRQPGKKVGVLGFSFKAGTDDLRESPVVELVERLIGKGYEVILFDRNVNLARLVGANREYINRHIPHIARLMVESVDEVLAKADTIVIGNGDPAFGSIIERLRPHQRVVDLVRAVTPPAGFEGYEGICW